jgi:hypothetical protein
MLAVSIVFAESAGRRKGIALAVLAHAAVVVLAVVCDDATSYNAILSSSFGNEFTRLMFAACAECACDTGAHERMSRAGLAMGDTNCTSVNNFNNDAILGLADQR